MLKRLLSLTLALSIATIAMAYSFAGKTYRYTGAPEGIKGSITVKFTSASKGVITSTGFGSKTSSLYFNYEVSGEIINVYSSKGYDYFYIDTDQEYGDDSIYLLDPYGNVLMVFDRAATTSTPKKKTGGKKRK